MLTQIILKCNYNRIRNGIEVQFYTITYEDPIELMNYIKFKYQYLLKTALSDIFFIDYRPYNDLKLYHLQADTLRVTDENDHVLFVQSFPVTVFYYFPRCGDNKVKIFKKEMNVTNTINLNLITFTEFLTCLILTKEEIALFRFRQHILFDFNVLSHVREFSKDV